MPVYKGLIRAVDTAILVRCQADRRVTHGGGDAEMDLRASV